ncbi:Rhodanese-related sulfurtransferase [Psychrobacter pacificensis]|jgi:rhodanese-related sulfurtransferase|uniref:Rhodanese-like domain-containing protein n=1 Tax=Psychrobacter pacificensis TaxID=112002 RepID=A0A1G7AXQ2_9GAMM|nr:rhodanese-like domain-containing protein [Psychrobacter pacificensis]HBD04529.1 sulfurtransferase [Psychrobacter sp.]SDE19573.1 Rhodanese-related sulfurtransferase [Psychrobacter pacificensis]GLR29827.1 rhodanese-like domain-containing protein [Psychrobacter pacificensis]HBL96995.1 sulfurtransferase [Psychrobacter sp.]HCI30360.1 sulfurtransferase [Psychrobacter sp.]|tara:strand:- start:2561 stop:2944 length:384 start_codon:yes stop_codon:yes gene_type:complete
MKTSHDLVSAAKAQITEIPVAQAQVACHKADIIIDVREPAEYAAGHIKGAISVPRGILEFRISDLPAIKGADTEILLYCQSSGRAALAAQSLAELGYTQVASIAGGYEACLETDIPITMANEGINFY